MRHKHRALTHCIAQSMSPPVECCESQRAQVQTKIPTMTSPALTPCLTTYMTPDKRASVKCEPSEDDNTTTEHVQQEATSSQPIGAHNYAPHEASMAAPMLHHQQSAMNVPYWYAMPDTAWSVPSSLPYVSYVCPRLVRRPSHRT